VTGPQRAFAEPGKDSSAHAPRTNRRAPSPLPLATSSMLFLQRTIGNQAVQRLMSVQRHDAVGARNLERRLTAIEDSVYKQAGFGTPGPQKPDRTTFEAERARRRAAVPTPNTADLSDEG
jgi:hypothetical protein